jgi:hypothetical protein
MTETFIGNLPTLVIIVLFLGCGLWACNKLILLEIANGNKEDVNMDKYILRKNYDLEGWDLLKVNGIAPQEDTPNGEDEWIATFYDRDVAEKVVSLLGSDNQH